MKIVPVRMSDEDIRKLKKAAKAAGVSVSDIVRMAVKEKVK